MNKDLVIQLSVPLALRKQSAPTADIYRLLDTATCLEMTTRPNRNISLKNVGNTCAIDSVLAALCSHYQFDEEDDDAVKSWLADISSKDDITGLASLLPPHEDNFSQIGEPKDAIEFLLFLLNNVIPGEFTSTKVFKTVTREGEITHARVDRTSCPVQYTKLTKSTNIHELLSFPTRISDNVFSIEEIVSGDIVVFACDRSNSEYVGYMRPCPSLTTPNGDRFFLGSIVVADSSHYTAYIRDRDEWFVKDDLSPNKDKIIGTFSDMIEQKDVLTKGVLYFYFPDYSCAEEHMLSRWVSVGELAVGVFYDQVTDKISYLSETFSNVHVEKTLVNIRNTVSKSSSVPPSHSSSSSSSTFTLRIMPARNFLRTYIKNE